MSDQVIFTDMKEAAAFVAGWDRTVANWATDRTNLFEVIKKDALARFENAYDWSFLYVNAALELSPTYSTGTVGIASGVVTLADGTWPSWAAQGDLWIVDAGATQRYSVASRGGDDEITLDDTSVDVDAATSYNLRRHSYDLPADFAGTLDYGFAFRRDSVYAGCAIKQVGLADFQQLDTDLGSSSGVPAYFALQAVAVTATTSTAWRAMFTPLPSSQMFLDYRYKVAPADVDSTNDFPYGGAIHSATILSSIEYSTALYLQLPTVPMFAEKFERCLQQSIKADGHFRPVDYGPGYHGTRSLERHSYISIDDATFSFS